MATIWTHCSITATKAGKGHGGNKQQIIKHFCTAMKQFIDVFGALYICHEDEREAPSLIRHLFSRQNDCGDTDGVSLDKGKVSYSIKVSCNCIIRGLVRI